MDENRAEDGIGLRERYLRVDPDYTFKDCLYECSMLEMMIALAIRIEEHILYDPEEGSHVQSLFWGMIRSMELYELDDADYIHLNGEEDVEITCLGIGYHSYCPDGKGGLFRIPGRTDMQEKEIWQQAMIYLNDKEKTYGRL